MPYFSQFNNIFTAGDDWDRISAINRTCAAMLFFQYNNGSYGGGPYYVWSSSEGESHHLARSMPIVGVPKDQMATRVRLRNTVADWRAYARRGQPDYRHTGHAEEFLIADFPTCLAIVGAANVRRAHISITWSPCIGGLDNRASNNLGVVKGCYNKLNFLAARHPGLQFDVSFKVPFGTFSGNGDGAEAYLNANRFSQNISFEYAPETG